jgi:transaldolase / glucose-6-phosphate isomerase
VSTGAYVNERLAALTAAGTSVWLDSIRRGLIETGELERLVREDSLRGVTANPAIFEKAILGSRDYDAQLAALAAGGADRRAVYETLAVTDVQMAADVLRPVWEQAGHRDGFVSLEVAPDLAHDTEGTLAEARRFWRELDRPNVMIKIPGTPEGFPAIEQATYEGLNINVTLLFSVEAYEAVAEAYIRGMERRAEEGRSLDVHSVASFFVSRIDSVVDKRLAADGREDLQGIAGIANARRAYRRFRELFRGERFARLRAEGAPVQRPLWASTGVKNPEYRDTMYVEELVAPDTVNTMPMATLLAASDHAEIAGSTADRDSDEALSRLEEAGVDLAEVTEQVLQAGIDAFLVSLDKLLEGIEAKREAIVTRRPPTIASSIPDALEPDIASVIEDAAEADVPRRIWKRDGTLWGEAHASEASHRLGWLTVVDAMHEEVAELLDFARACRGEGLTDAILLGMGGSSLAPEVFRLSFGEREDYLRLHVLDSTDPGAIEAIEAAVDLDHALFVVSSKSGGTIETLSHFAYFWERVPRGDRFVAITDLRSPLERLATEHGFRRTFLNDPEIGGRYSALSYFGLVPAALIGADIGGLLERAGVAEQACVSYDSSEANSGLWLGLALGALARRGYDKLTFVVSEPIASFGLWVEQLVAESTGKDGRGVVPVTGEPLGSYEAYGDDRVFVYLRNVDAPDAEHDTALEALARAGHPTITLAAHGAADLGRPMFFAEFATAVAGWALGVNPFDQPNVQEAKDRTQDVLARYESEGSLPEVPEADDAALRALVLGAEPPAYVAIMGYVQPSAAFDAAVEELRRAIRDASRAATTFGYGPRYLHSTGQLHKGGPPGGRFLQLTHDGARDIDVPGRQWSFATLEEAQALGDLETLRSRGLRAERFRLHGENPVDAVCDLTSRIKEMS